MFFYFNIYFESIYIIFNDNSNHPQIYKINIYIIYLFLLKKIRARRYFHIKKIWFNPSIVPTNDLLVGKRKYSKTVKWTWNWFDRWHVKTIIIVKKITRPATPFLPPTHFTPDPKTFSIPLKYNIQYTR